MRTRHRVVVKRTFYVPPDRAHGFKDFTNDATSEAMQHLLILWPAIPGEARDRIAQETAKLPFAEAVKAARRIIEESVLDQYRLRYVKSMPPQKQLNLFKSHRR